MENLSDNAYGDFIEAISERNCPLACLIWEQMTHEHRLAAKEVYQKFDAGLKQDIAIGFKILGAKNILNELGASDEFFSLVLDVGGMPYDVFELIDACASDHDFLVLACEALSEHPDKTLFLTVIQTLDKSVYIKVLSKLGDKLDKKITGSYPYKDGIDVTEDDIKRKANAIGKYKKFLLEEGIDPTTEPDLYTALILEFAESFVI